MIQPGFKRDELRARYAVSAIHEDQWHSFGDQWRREFVKFAIPSSAKNDGRLLNAGSGIYALNLSSWEEVAIDLFNEPLLDRKLAVCGNVANLPFCECAFDAVVCTGEVLGYCDPPRAIAEFSRVIRPCGMLLCDFGSTRSSRYWMKKAYGRASDLVTVEYNGEPERIWIYDPKYILSLLRQFGFRVIARYGIYGWATLLARLGAAPSFAVRAEWLQRIMPFPAGSADIAVIVAQRL